MDSNPLTDGARIAGVAAAWWRRLLCWPVLGLVLVAAGIYATKPFPRLDLALYDAALPSNELAPDITVVSIDERSVEHLGHWPWPREIHAQLLDSLRAAGARAVVLDLPLSDPDAASPNNDLALTAALRRGPPTILPVQIDLGIQGAAPKVEQPLPEFTNAAAGLGHANLEPDPDGLVRSVCLREGPEGAVWSYVAAALLPVLGAASTLPGQQGSDRSLGADWVRDHCILIPFSESQRDFTQVSYLDVVQGKVSPAVLRNRIVLVGMAVEGLGVLFATPRSDHDQRLAGVEVMADVLQTLRAHTQITAASAPFSMALATLPLLLAALLIPAVPPRSAFMAIATLSLGVLVAAFLLLRILHYWWSPVGCVAALLVAYPLYSWQRLSAARRQLNSKLRRLTNEPLSRLQPSASAAWSQQTDFALGRISVLREATESLKTVHSLIASAVSCLPDATVLLDMDGRILLANPAAVSLFRADGNLTTAGAAFGDIVERHLGMLPGTFIARVTQAPSTEEVVFRETQRHFYMRVVPFLDETQRRVGTLISFSDITQLRSAQRERDDLIRFLSHDMKSPVTSLLGLAELQADQTRALSAQELSERIRLLARRLLSLLDSFIMLSRAESADPQQFGPLDARDAVQDACDEVWAAAEVRRVTIRTDITNAPCPIIGARQLLARALINILANAVKFAPEYSTVDVACVRRHTDISVTVTDRGPGIDPQRLGQMFRRFARGFHNGPGDPGGVGLGLALVKVVADKHRGTVSVGQQPGETALRLILPLAGAPPP